MIGKEFLDDKMGEVDTIRQLPSSFSERMNTKWFSFVEHYSSEYQEATT
jgi:hypothetical protein